MINQSPALLLFHKKLYIFSVIVPCGFIDSDETQSWKAVAEGSRMHCLLVWKAWSFCDYRVPDESHQRMKTLTQTSMSMNSSNPILRWGHTPQPIIIAIEIRHPVLSQSTRLCFSLSLSLLSPPCLGFILSDILFHVQQPTPRAGSG